MTDQRRMSEELFTSRVDRPCPSVILTAKLWCDGNKNVSSRYRAASELSLLGVGSALLRGRAHRRCPSLENAMISDGLIDLARSGAAKPGSNACIAFLLDRPGAAVSPEAPLNIGSGAWCAEQREPSAVRDGVPPLTKFTCRFPAAQLSSRRSRGHPVRNRGTAGGRL